MGCTPSLLLSLALSFPNSLLCTLLGFLDSAFFISTSPFAREDTVKLNGYRSVNGVWPKEGLLMVTLTSSLGPLARAQLPECLEGHLEADHFCAGSAWNPKTGVVIPKS